MLPLTFILEELYERSDSWVGLPLIGGKRCPERNEAITIECRSTAKGHAERQKDKKGEWSLFSVADRFHSHSR